MKPHIKALMDKANKAKYMYKLGYITREEALVDIVPYIDAINARAKELCKESGVAFKKVSVIGYLR